MIYYVYEDSEYGINERSNIMDQNIDRSKITAEINTWKPRTAKEVIVESNDQMFIVHFEKFFPLKMEKFDTFYVRKSSFEPHLAVSAKYINYFINRYDMDNELVLAFLKLKWLLDEKKFFTAENVHQLIDLIYELVFTPTICEKIRQLVDDNYLDDIERDVTKYKSNANQDYLESLEFTNKHNKILLRISFGMRIICPIMYHYFCINKIKPDTLKDKKDVTIVYDFYYPLFKLFSDGVDMFNKLYVYIKRKVLDSSYHNQKIFNQRDIFGDDIMLVIERFVKTRLIVDNMVKYKFNKTWDPKKQQFSENIIGLNKVIIKFQIVYFLKETYGKTLTEMTNTKNSEGLSASDKMEMNLTKLDTGIIDLANINVDFCLSRLLKDIDVPITEEEIQYYRDNHYPSDIQVHLVRSAYAEFFASYRDENLLTRRQYNILLLLLKKRLLLENGYGIDEVGEESYLAHILCGNLEGKVNTKHIRNNKLMAELEENPTYQYLITEKYKELEEHKPGYVKGLISTFLSTQFRYVCYEKPELTGQIIVAPEKKLCDELLFFLKTI